MVSQEKQARKVKFEQKRKNREPKKEKGRERSRCWEGTIPWAGATRLSPKGKVEVSLPHTDGKEVLLLKKRL